MSPTDTRALMVALRTSDHKYLGIRPSDATPAESPCILLEEASANALSYAMVTAGQFWPQCVSWALIASDTRLAGKPPDGIPTLHALRMPTTIATFTTVHSGA